MRPGPVRPTAHPPLESGAQCTAKGLTERPFGALRQRSHDRALNGGQRKTGLRVAQIDGEAIPQLSESRTHAEARIVKHGNTIYSMVAKGGYRAISRCRSG